MNHYLLEVNESQVNISLLDTHRKWNENLGKLTTDFSQFVLVLYGKNYITDFSFEVPVIMSIDGLTTTITIDTPDATKVLCGPLDLLNVSSIRKFFNIHRPVVTVQSDLDHLTMTGFAKLAIAGQIKMTQKGNYESKQKPTSKKEVKKLWKYQG